MDSIGLFRNALRDGPQAFQVFNFVIDLLFRRNLQLDWDLNSTRITTACQGHFTDEKPMSSMLYDIGTYSARWPGLLVGSLVLDFHRSAFWARPDFLSCNEQVRIILRRFHLSRVFGKFILNWCNRNHLRIFSVSLMEMPLFPDVIITY